MKKGLLLLMLIFSVSLLGNNAFNKAKSLVSGKVLSANFGNDGQRKLFVVTNTGAYLFIKQGNSFNKFFSKTFKNGETPFFRSAGLKDIDNNGKLDFFYSTKRNNKKYLYTVNTAPKKGKYSFYQVALSSNNRIHKSGNLRNGSSFHNWMQTKVKNLNTNVSNTNIVKRPPLKVVGGQSAVSVAGGLVDAKILKAGFYTNQNGSRFLFAITSQDAYLFKKSGSSYNQFFSKKLKRYFRPVLSNVGIYDINGNGFGDFYYMAKDNNLKKILVVINTKPKNGKYSIYQLQRNAQGNLNKSGNLRANSDYHNWMKKKLVGNETVSIPVDNKPKLSGDYIYICDISTNGRGGYKTGGKYCGISVNDLKGHEVVFQQVYGPAKFIAAHERFRNGNWKVTYKGTLRALRLKDIRKTNKSTHINFTVNGTNEQYDKSVTKVRVYKKALRAKMPNDQEARELVRMQGILKRSESISKVFIYTEAGKTKIAAITTRGLYILENQGYDNWRTTLRYKIKLKNVRMNTQFNGMQDVDNDGVRDIYFSTIDKKKGYNLLNLFLVKKNAIHTAYGKLGEAIGDFDPEVEFKFTSNTPKTVRPWLKKMIYQFGFVKKPREISESDPKDAVRFWVRDNGFLSSKNDLQLRLRMYNGDQDRNFVPVNKGVHPVTATITVNNVIYRSHYKGIVTAYDRNTNKSYVVYVPKTKRNFVTAFSSGNNKVFLGTQNDGIVILDKSSNVLKIFRHKKLKNKDIWKIVKKHNHYLVFTDSNKAVKVKAKKLER